MDSFIKLTLNYIMLKITSENDVDVLTYTRLIFCLTMSQQC